MPDKSFTKILSLTAPYGVLIAILYLLGFWGAFHLNIFEFLSLSDLLMLSIKPLLSSFFPLLIGVASAKILLPSLPPGGGNDTTVGRFGLKHWRYFLGLLFIISIIPIIFSNNPLIWRVAFILIIFPLSTLLTHFDYFIELIPNPSARAIILMLLLYFPGHSFIEGRLNANAILEGNAEYIVDAQASNILFDAEKFGPLSYIGYVAGRYILYDNSFKKTIFVNANSKELLVLKHNPNKN